MNKDQIISIRITQRQFEKLADALIDEHRNKSELIRGVLDDYLNRKNKTEGNPSKKIN